MSFAEGTDAHVRIVFPAVHQRGLDPRAPLRFVVCWPRDGPSVTMCAFPSLETATWGLYPSPTFTDALHVPLRFVE
ncbi:MAG: hypothetical protein H0X16_01210 [Chloroflexi bacterium]|nr:hypothetical protein [Chloroflexota bacterium]